MTRSMFKYPPHTALLSASLSLVASTAYATDNSPVTIPKGCSAFVTVQLENCRVSHLFTCESQPEGHNNRLTLSQDGPLSLAVVDNETQWINTFYFQSGNRDSLGKESKDPASFSELIDTGIDTFDFNMMSSNDTTERNVGYDQLAGEQVIIDDIPLALTTYEVTSYDSDKNITYKSSGQQYIHEEWRVFFGGVSTFDTLDGSDTVSEAPKEFIFQGEAGFLSANPKYGCGAEISAAPTTRPHYS